MSRRLKPTEYVVNGNCSPNCALNPKKLGPEKHEMVMEWFQSAKNDHKMEDLGRQIGITVTHGIYGRHRKLHLDEKGAQSEDESLAEKDDVEILDVILKKGATQIPGWRITPSEWFKALEMKYRLTQGSTMDAMYAAMAAAGAEGEEEDSETEDRREELEETGERPSVVLQSLPVERSPSGSGEMAPE